MDYNKLKTLVIVAEFNSVSVAAAHLRRTQSAISQQIKLLEDELGMRLLDRRNARVYLSPEGQKIYQLAKEKLGQIDDGILSFKSESESVQGSISVCVLHDFGTEFDIGDAVGNFSQHYPHVTFSVQHAGTSEIVESLLIEHRVDLGLIVVFRQPEMFVRVPVAKAWHSLYTSKNYLEKHGLISSYKDLLDKDLIDLTDDFLGLRTFLEKNSKKSAVQLKRRRPSIVAPNLSVAKSIVTSGYGISMLPDYLVSKECKAGKIIKLFPSAKPLCGVLDVAFRSNRTLRLCERLFIKYLESQYREI